MLTFAFHYSENGLKKENRYWILATMLMLTGWLTTVWYFMSMEHKKQRRQPIRTQAVARELSELRDLYMDASQQNQVYHYLLTDSLDQAKSIIQEYKGQEYVKLEWNNFVETRQRIKAFLAKANEQGDKKLESLAMLEDLKKRYVNAEQDLRQTDSTNKLLNLEVQQLRNQLASAEANETSTNQQLVFKNTKGTKVFYVGEVLNGKAHGDGMAVFETLSTYNGEWQKGNRHGKGKHTWKDGETYEGQFENDKRSGVGTYSYLTGEKFSGFWKNDMRDGEGILYDAKGKVRLKGVWKADRFQRANGSKSATLQEDM